MDIRNRPSKVAVQAASEQFLKNSRDAVVSKLEGLGKIFYMVVGGKRLKILENVDVKGSDNRDVTKLNEIYQDLVGRYTLTPTGKGPVGLLLRGGTNQRKCHIGLYE